MNKVIYTKQDFIDKLKDIANMGWNLNSRPGNSGGVGNTLEDLLGITENNLPIPNSAEWELKAQRSGTSSLITLFHFEPSPRALKFVPQILIPLYGWQHKEAGARHSFEELSFRQTIHGKTYSDRGFIVQIDRQEQKVLISFSASNVDEKHRDWKDSVNNKTGLNDLDPQPYWGFSDLEHKAGTKLINCFHVNADVKIENNKEYFKYNKVLMLQTFSFPKFLNALGEGNVLIDFDARSGHNHGTKFRIRQNTLPELYDKVTTILP